MTKIDALKKAAEAYYNSEAIMLDAEYDRLYEEAKAENPNDPFFRTVGAAPSGLFTKVKHAIPMGSLDKVKDENELARWLSKARDKACQRIKVLIQWKFDGCSLSLKYEKGELIRAVSRGDGLTGEDLTENVKKSRFIPKKLNEEFTGYVRGEVILHQDEFKAHFPDCANPRNTGNGALRNKNGDGCEWLRLKAFDVLCDGKPCCDSERDNQEYLKRLGFDVDEGALVSDVNDGMQCIIEIKSVYDKRREERSSLPFEVDGLVLRIDDVAVCAALGVHDGRPRGMTAYKFPPLGGKSILRSIEWTVGHTGAITPTCKIDPINIGGVTVTSALVNNEDEIRRLNLGIGGEVEVIRAGDVIPKLMSCKGGVPIVIPTACPVCGGAVARDGAALICQNDECDGKAIRKVRRWMKSLDIKFIGPEIEAALYESGLVKDPADLYALDMGRLPNLVVGNGVLGIKRATSILDEINKKRELSLSEFLGSLGIRFLGKRAAEEFIKKCGRKTLNEWLTMTETESTVLGGGIGPTVVRGLVECRGLIDKLLAGGVKVGADTDEKKETATGGKLSGFCFVFTGSLPSGMKRAGAQALVRENGGTTKDDVGSGVTHLVQADPSSQSNKTKKATKIGAKIISEEQFMEMIQ